MKYLLSTRNLLWCLAKGTLAGILIVYAVSTKNYFFAVLAIKELSEAFLFTFCDIISDEDEDESKN